MHHLNGSGTYAFNKMPIDMWVIGKKINITINVFLSPHDESKDFQGVQAFMTSVRTSKEFKISIMNQKTFMNPKTFIICLMTSKKSQTIVMHLGISRNPRHLWWM